jgi:hypothetical protein
VLLQRHCRAAVVVVSTVPEPEMDNLNLLTLRAPVVVVVDRPALALVLGAWVQPVKATVAAPQIWGLRRVRGVVVARSAEAQQAMLAATAAMVAPILSPEHRSHTAVAAAAVFHQAVVPVAQAAAVRDRVRDRVRRALTV